jgi:hypothetical protein
MEEASYEGVRVFVVAATGAYSFSALRDMCFKPTLGLTEPKLVEPVFPKTEVMTKLMHDRDPHLTRNGLGRGACPLQRPAKNDDSVWRNQVVLATALGERDPLIQAEQGILVPCGETIKSSGDTSLSDLICGRLVFDDHVHVVEHGRDLRWEAIQRTGDNPLKPLVPRVLDTATNPVLHTANDTSFGVIPPIYGEPEAVRTVTRLSSSASVFTKSTLRTRTRRYTRRYDQ